MRCFTKALSGLLFFLTTIFALSGCALGRIHFNYPVYEFSSGVWNWVNKNPSFSKRQNVQAVPFKGSIWLIGGRSDFTRMNDVWCSANGSNWTSATASATSSGRDEFGCDTDGNRIWIAAGFGSTFRNDVWYTTNGTNWSQATSSAPFSARSGVTLNCFNGALWAIGGNASAAPFLKDVWVSTNLGSNWSLVTNTAPFGERYHHRCVVFNNALWLIGGWASDGIRSDAWFTLDGTNWTQATTNIGFQVMLNGLVVYNNRLFIAAGWMGGFTTAQTWFSSDGTNWTQVSSGSLPSRQGHACVTNDNKIWIMAGNGPNSSAEEFNDVWMYYQ